MLWFILFTRCYITQHVKLSRSPFSWLLPTTAYVFIVWVITCSTYCNSICFNSCRSSLSIYTELDMTWVHSVDRVGLVRVTEFLTVPGSAWVRSIAQNLFKKLKFVGAFSQTSQHFECTCHYKIHHPLYLDVACTACHNNQPRVGSGAARIGPTPFPDRKS